jgi:hypothetical protein
VYLGKNVIKCAGTVVKETLTQTMRKVMTYEQCLKYAINWTARHVLGYKNISEYQPELEKCVDHFLIHAGAQQLDI